MKQCQINWRKHEKPQKPKLLFRKKKQDDKAHTQKPHKSKVLKLSLAAMFTSPQTKKNLQGGVSQTPPRRHNEYILIVLMSYNFNKEQPYNVFRHCIHLYLHIKLFN